MNEENFRRFTLELSNWAPNLVPILIGMLLLTGLGLVIYDLFKTGKKGFGWAAILMLVGLLAFTLRVAISVFREMAASASGSSGSDWDG